MQSIYLFLTTEEKKNTGLNALVRSSEENLYIMDKQPWYNFN